MGALAVIVRQELIEIVLQLLKRAVQLLAERDPVQLVEGDRCYGHRDPGRRLARISQCAMERRLLLTDAKPVQQLSLRLAAARADHGGNDMV